MQSNFFTRLLTFALLLGVVPMLAQTPFYTEDFDDEAAATAAWTVGGENEGTLNWTYSSNPSWMGNNFFPFGAPTADNGFFYFDSNGNDFQASNHVVTLTSPSIDCSGQSGVFLEMYTQYLYYFYDRVLFGEPNVEVGVSVNGGDFLYQSILEDVDATDTYISVQRVTLPLADAIGQADVRIQIRWTGNWEYFMNVDDIALYDVDPILANDLEIDDVWVPSAYATPLSQIDSIFFIGTASNIGADPQTNVRMRTTVLQSTDSGFNQVFRDSSESLNMLDAGIVDSLILLENGFLPTESGTYLVSQTLVADETDDFSPNNQDFFEFVVSTRTFANDDNQTNWPPLLPAEVTEDFWEGGNLFYVKNGQGYEADSIHFNFFSENNAHVGQSGLVNLYKIVEDDNPLLTSDDLVSVGFNNFEFTAEDQIGRFKSVALTSDGLNEGVMLEDSTEYIAMVSLPSNVWFFYSYRDIIYEIASVIRNGDDLSRFSPELAMMIRMSIREAQPDAVKEPQLDDARINSFPNPAKDFYRIDLDLENTSAVRLELTNTAGQMIMQREYTALQRDRIDLDVSDLAVGTYFVKVRTEEGVKTLKFVKQ